MHHNFIHYRHPFSGQCYCRTSTLIATFTESYKCSQRDLAVVTLISYYFKVIFCHWCN